MNSLQLSDWYSVSRQDVIDKGGRKVVDRYYSFAEALRTLYPDFEWEASKFINPPHSSRGYWYDPANQRELMDRIAKELGVNEVNYSYVLYFLETL